MEEISLELNLMTFENLKKELEDYLINIRESISSEMIVTKKVNVGKFIQQVSSKLRTILCDLEKYPILKMEQAIGYYFDESRGYQRITEKYELIIKLQDYISTTAEIPFYYDRYTILKILQITLLTYNKIIEDCTNGVLEYDENVASVFLDLETMLLNDRNASAENNNANAKAIDNVNRYSKKSGGYGVRYESEDKQQNKKIIVVTNEETMKKLETRYDFVNLANKK